MIFFSFLAKRFGWSIHAPAQSFFHQLPHPQNVSHITKRSPKPNIPVTKHDTYDTYSNVPPVICTAHLTSTIKFVLIKAITKNIFPSEHGCQQWPNLYFPNYLPNLFTFYMGWGGGGIFCGIKGLGHEMNNFVEGLLYFIGTFCIFAELLLKKSTSKFFLASIHNRFRKPSASITL